MSFPEVEIPDLNLSLPDLHLSLECGDNVVKLQTLRGEIPHIPTEHAEEEALTEDVASEMLFLSKRKLKDVADSILKNSALKNLYLEGNQISSLPDSLFTSLPNLVWLDFRNNQISSLPAEIGVHRSLRTLLLEGNPITELPPELGNVITLKALNLRNCPIRFPPQDIVHQGLQCILQYLRSALAERPLSKRNSYPDMSPVEKLQLSELVKSSMELCEEVVDEDELKMFRELKQKMILMDRAELGYGVPTLPLAHPPGTAEGDRNPKLRTLPAIRRQKDITKADIIPELPPFDMQYWKRSEERKLVAIKEVKERQTILEQRRKDQEVLREWRTHAKVVQERKILEHKQERRERQERKEGSMMPPLSQEALKKMDAQRSETTTALGRDGALYTCRKESVILEQQDVVTAGAQIPWTPQTTLSTTKCEFSDVDQNDTTAHTSHSSPQRLQRQRPFKSQMEYEEARMARDHELEQRIRSHVQMMQERHSKPRGTLQEETAAAQQDMAETRKLQAELLKRKKGRDIEYRFIAFTGETSPFLDK